MYQKGQTMKTPPKTPATNTNSLDRDSFKSKPTDPETRNAVREIRQATGMGLLEAHIFFALNGHGWCDKVSHGSNANPQQYDYREFHRKTVEIVSRFRVMSGKQDLTGLDAELALAQICKLL